MPDRGARVLLVLDEPPWGELLAVALAAAGYGVRAVGSGAAARAAVDQDPPDLVVLDLILPDEDGLVLCADLKAAAVPVLVCSATRRRRDAPLALQLGADDFVPRPCEAGALVERAGALLRTRPPAPSAGAAPIPSERATAELGLVLDRVQQQARLGAAAVTLRPTEYWLLAVLAGCPGEVVPRQALVRAVLGQPEDRRALDTLVWRLRGKLAALGPRAPRIQAVRGIGYALLAAPPPDRR